MVANIHDECFFHALELFKDISDKILKFVRVAYPWETTKYTPTLTGVPPHVIVIMRTYWV